MPMLSARQFIGAATTALSLITGAFLLALTAANARAQGSAPACDAAGEIALLPRAAPAAARVAVSACSRPRAQLVDPEELRRRSIQQAVFARAISNHRSPATRTTTYSTTSGAIRLFRTAYRALGYHTTFCLFDRRDDFANSILRMGAINWSWSTVCFRARRRA